MDTQVILGRVKRGTDKVFRDIVVGVDGDPQDLSAEGWTVTSRLRHRIDSPSAVDLDIDQDELANSIVRLALSSDTTTDMAEGTWYGDVLVESPSGKQASATFRVLVEALVSRPDPPPPEEP